MHARLIAVTAVAAAFTYSRGVSAQENPCASPPESFQGFSGAGLVQVGKSLAGIPSLATARFSYREIRHSPCADGAPVFPPGIGEASVSFGVPIFNHRRGGWLLQMAAQAEGSQKPGEPVRGSISGAPATAGHLNIWETPLPLIQLSGAASAAITPDSQEFPLSMRYLGGVRVFPLYAKHAQANLGLTVGGSNALVNFVPSFAFRASDLPILNHKIAIGVEVRSPILLSAGPTPFEWRFWGALTVAVEEIDDRNRERSSGGGTPVRSFDLARSPSEDAPPTQTTWETTL
ncbi:hypothetical protein [Polyangium aurulentum]|uniref:hypothetical protein n=1 Tax=Polyangium aurulentum TaxID=2567896 RepID=UPI0010ADBF13|nr:hypothetical protein [Polyangium aurulentum]UQA55813.1 hypothetical protein E8A73_031345 [Polyangium aurulentum]